MFGNQVFNVSGSRDHHHGNRVQTICFMAENTAITYNTFGEIFAKVQSRVSVNYQKSPLSDEFLEKELFTCYIELEAAEEA